MKFANFLVLSTMLLSFSAVAGDKGGNGGDAIVCPDKVILLDYHEMNQRSMVLSLSGSSMDEKVADVIAKITQVDPDRAHLINFYANELLRDIRKYDQGQATTNINFTDDVLSDVPDSMEVSIPRGCVKEQLVNQREPVFPQDRRYTIAKSFWDRMDVEQKTLTVLHESWYRTLLLEGAQDSRVARYLNALFASNEVFSFEEYLEKLKFAARLGSYPGGEVPYSYSLQGNYMRIKFKEKDPEGNLEFDITSRTNGTYQLKNYKVQNTRFLELTLSPDRKMVKLRNGFGIFFTIDPSNVTRTDGRHTARVHGDPKDEVRVGVFGGVIEIGGYRIEKGSRYMLIHEYYNRNADLKYSTDTEVFDIDADLNITNLQINATAVYKDGVLIKVPKSPGGNRDRVGPWGFWYNTRGEYCTTKDLCVRYNYEDIN